MATSPDVQAWTALERERNELAAVLEVSRAAATLPLVELIDKVAASIDGTRWRWDYTSLLMYEPAERALRQHHLFARPPLREAAQRRLGGQVLWVPIEGTQAGQVFSTGQPYVVNSKPEYLAMVSPAWRERVAEQLPASYSSCIVPLICRGERLGTLASASDRDDAFDSEAVQFLGRIADAIAPAVANARAYRQIEELKTRLAKEKTDLRNETSGGIGEIVGESPALRRVLELVESVASTDTSVLIQGETGTGKELVARAIHQRSRRREHNFIKLNCAAIPGGLFESELFGHEKGAFTSAVGQKIGRFELTHGGTLFLDEVGEIPLDVQPKLLRVLQDQEFERLGGTRTLKVDVRVLAATNCDLAEMTATRRFRSDLFYRLNVFPITLPPLRDRRGDIPLLAQHFVQRSAERLHRSISVIPSEVLAVLGRYHWPGNVRELKNVIERSVILSPGPELRLPGAELHPGSRGPEAGSEAQRTAGAAGQDTAAPLQTLAQAECAFIVRALEQTNWVVGGTSGAASRLGLSRTTLQARMRKLGITRPR
jgi:formate hydrogenlyase transcriptional activator